MRASKTTCLSRGAPHVRFYAGVSIQSLAGFRLGTLCIFDTVPRVLSMTELSVFLDLALTAQDVVRSHEAKRKAIRRFMRMYHDTIPVV